MVKDLHPLMALLFDWALDWAAAGYVEAAGLALQWLGGTGNSFDSALMSKRGAYGSWGTGAIAGEGDTGEEDFPDKIISAERACDQLPSSSFSSPSP